MMRSMQSAVTGLRAQQTAMDTIGNNIANVNTPGFKASLTEFSDLFYQTLNGGNETINPSQVGYGAQISTVSKNMSSVGAQTTDNPTDLYLDGAGYFALNTKPDGSGVTYYSRVGNFHFTPQGYLVDKATGNYVMSNIKKADGTYQPVQLDTGNGQQIYIKDAAGNVTPITKDDITYKDLGNVSHTFKANFSQLSSITINKDGSITASIGDTTGTIVVDTSNWNPTGLNVIPTTEADLEFKNLGHPTVTEQVGLNMFLNPDGLTQIGNNFYTANKSSGPAVETTAGSNNNTGMISGELEMSNVDVAKEFTNMIQTQRGFQANSRIITVSDSMLEELVNLKRS